MEKQAELIARLQAQVIAHSIALRLMFAMNPREAQVIRQGTMDLGDLLMPFSLTDAQIQEVQRTLAQLIAPIPPATP